MTPKTICIIGAGVSGLAAAKALREEGLEPVIFETKDGPGGLWHYDESLPGGGGPAYRHLTANTSRQIIPFSDLEMPADHPDFVSRGQMLAYLQRYTHRFDLTRYIAFNSRVESAVQRADGRWRVTWRNGTGGLSRDVFDALVVGTGRNQVPLFPDAPMWERFAGRKLHSLGFTHPDDIGGGSVLVVGAGSSAGDIAAQLASAGIRVTMSSRGGGWFIPHYVMGRPFDHHLSRLGSRLPRTAKQLVLRKLIGAEYARAGLSLSHPLLRWPACGFHPANTRITPQNDILGLIADGRIEIQPAVADVNGPEVSFRNGTRQRFDAVVFATGYGARYPFLPDEIGRGLGFPPRLFKLVFPAGIRNMAMLGFALVQGPSPPVIELQARWAAAVFSGSIALPPVEEMEREISKRERMQKAFGAPFNRVDLIPYQDELARMIGVKPSVWRNPGMWRELLLGPPLPSQFRLTF